MDMDTGVSYQDVVEVLKGLPPAQVEEVYDFARFLQSQRAHASVSDSRAAFLATFGAWKDERSDEEIIAEIYRSRTAGLNKQ
jgi:hypothetical protein